MSSMIKSYFIDRDTSGYEIKYADWLNIYYSTVLIQGNLKPKVAKRQKKNHKHTSFSIQFSGSFERQNIHIRFYLQTGICRI